MNFIINADDLGKSSAVNDAVFEMISSRLITSSTLMINGEAIEDAACRIKRYPECSFGVHLNISEFKPLSRRRALREILNETGSFDLSRSNGRNRELQFNPALIRAIYGEWCAQIEKALTLGIGISHLDSHHSVHVRTPQLLFILKCIQKKYGISKVRIRKNIYSDPISKRAYLKTNAVNYALRKCFKTKTTSGFTEFACFLEAASSKSISHPSVELMVHPGNPSRYFINEIALLRTPWMDKLPMKVNLINYNDL